jgi:hypothetical protein
MYTKAYFCRANFFPAQVNIFKTINGIACVIIFPFNDRIIFPWCMGRWRSGIEQEQKILVRISKGCTFVKF